MIVKSLCDTDLYKLTMMQFAFHQFSIYPVEYKFKCRNKGVDLVPYINEIRKEVDLMGFLTFSEFELDYLKRYKNGIFKEDFLNYLRKFKLNPKDVKLSIVDNQMDIKISGNWTDTILWEVPLLAIVNEVYFRSVYSDPDYNLGLKILEEKIAIVNSTKLNPLKFIEFGTRRRFSQKWQEKVVKTLVEKLDSTYFKGTSNVSLAIKHDIPLSGTMAHEAFQAMQGVEGEDSYFKSQELMLRLWEKEYGKDLMIALSDIFGTKAFLKDITVAQAIHYQGFRQDSGDPFKWVDMIIDYYKKNNINPMNKLALFSDGLDVGKAIQINEYCKGKIPCLFGIGTSLTNSLGYPALNIVIKMVKANEKPVIKISDESSKAIGDERVISKVKNYYGI